MNRMNQSSLKNNGLAVLTLKNSAANQLNRALVLIGSGKARNKIRVLPTTNTPQSCMQSQEKEVRSNVMCSLFRTNT